MQTRLLSIMRLFHYQSSARKLALCLTALTWASSAHAIEYTVTGTLQHEVKGLENVTLPKGVYVCTNLEYTFTVAVADGRWSVRLVPTNAPAFYPGEDYLLAVGSGQEVLQVEDYETNQRRFKGQNAGHGTRGKGIVPYGIDKKAILLWYAFVSSSYLQSITNGLVYPLFALQNRHAYAQDFRIPGSWRLSADPPFLPEELRSTYIDESVKGTRAIFTNVVYITDGWHRFDRLRFPTSATAEYYDVVPGDKGPVRRLGQISTIHVLKVEPAASQSQFLAELPNPSTITDLDINAALGKAAVGLLATNWPSKEYLHSLQGTEKHNLSHEHLRRKELLVLFALLLAPLGLLGYRRIHWENARNQ